LNQGKKSGNQNHPIKNSCTAQVEQWEEEEGMETTLLKKIIEYRIQWEMKKMDTKFLTLMKQ
jgi:hypothetical protein